MKLFTEIMELSRFICCYHYDNVISFYIKGWKGSHQASFNILLNLKFVFQFSFKHFLWQHLSTISICRNTILLYSKYVSTNNLRYFRDDFNGSDFVPHLDDSVTVLVGAIHGHVTGPERVDPRKLSGHDLMKHFKCPMSNHYYLMKHFKCPMYNHYYLMKHWNG